MPCKLQNQSLPLTLLEQMPTRPSLRHRLWPRFRFLQPLPWIQQTSPNTGLQVTFLPYNARNEAQYTAFWQGMNLMIAVQGLFAICICIGSGDPVRVSRLLHNKYTGYNWSIYCWRHMYNLPLPKLCATSWSDLTDGCVLTLTDWLNSPHTVLCSALYSCLCRC